MQYGDVQIDPPGNGRAQATLSFTAVTVSASGQRIEARVIIHPNDLHAQMVKATKNRARKQSRDGALTVKILAH